MAIRNKNELSIAIVGVTGMVGRELLSILEESTMPIKKLKLFAGENSAGEVMDFRDEELVIEKLKAPHQIDTDIAFFAAGSQVSKTFIETVAQGGTYCIDKSSYFRMKPDVPLIVPEVNGNLLKTSGSHIIASPNCVAIPLTQVLAAIEKLSPIADVNVVTFQAVSGAGKKAQDELETQIRDLFNMREVKSDVLGKRIAFNVLPFRPMVRLTIEARPMKKPKLLKRPRRSSVCLSLESKLPACECRFLMAIRWRST